MGFFMEIFAKNRVTSNILFPREINQYIEIS